MIIYVFSFIFNIPRPKLPTGSSVPDINNIVVVAHGAIIRSMKNPDKLASMQNMTQIIDSITRYDVKNEGKQYSFTIFFWIRTGW